MATLRQERAIEEKLKVIEGKSNLTDKELLQKVGYCAGIAKHPARVRNSKGWNELMEKYMPDKLLAKKHKELLTVPIKIRTRTYKKGEELDIIEVEQLDTFAISKGLDMAYKLKGKYQDDKPTEPNQTINITQNILNVITKAEEEIQKALIDQIKND